MKDYKGYRLYVNLGASKTRRRLKGYGFGVKKVETAGTNQAVIIHTATGAHCQRLERLFADVMPPAAAKRDLGENDQRDDDPTSGTSGPECSE